MRYMFWISLVLAAGTLGLIAIATFLRGPLHLNVLSLVLSYCSLIVCAITFSSQTDDSPICRVKEKQ